MIEKCNGCGDCNESCDRDGSEAVSECMNLLSGVVGEVLFDGHSVLQELKDHEKLFISPEAVSGVLDAVVRLIKTKAI